MRISYFNRRAVVARFCPVLSDKMDKLVWDEDWVCGRIVRI